MIQLSIVNRDGDEVDLQEFETEAELLADWPYAECFGDYWEAWIGGKN